MNVNSFPPISLISDRYVNAVRRELTETLRQINSDCDDLLASTDCLMGRVLDGLTQRQRNAEVCLATLCQPYHDSGTSLHSNLVTLVRNKDKTAHKVQMLRTLALIRQANSDRLEQDTMHQGARRT